MALVTGSRFDDAMTPTVGQFTLPDGTVVARQASSGAGNDSCPVAWTPSRR